MVTDLQLLLWCVTVAQEVSHHCLVVGCELVYLLFQLAHAIIAV